MAAWSSHSRSLMLTMAASRSPEGYDFLQPSHCCLRCHSFWRHLQHRPSVRSPLPSRWEDLQPRRHRSGRCLCCLPCWQCCYCCCWLLQLSLVLCRRYCRCASTVLLAGAARGPAVPAGTYACGVRPPSLLIYRVWMVIRGNQATIVLLGAEDLLTPEPIGGKIMVGEWQMAKSYYE